MPEAEEEAFLTGISANANNIGKRQTGLMMVESYPERLEFQVAASEVYQMREPKISKPKGVYF